LQIQGKWYQERQPKTIPQPEAKNTKNYSTPFNHGRHPTLQDGLGGFFPASNYIDLGLFEHVGEAAATQKAPVKFGAQVYGMSDIRVSGWLLGWSIPIWWFILVDWWVCPWAP
jgi:hypothetical protein